jgi:twitching motility protein PilT
MNTVPVLSQLGFAKTYQSLLCSADLNKGLVVFCGGMGSGKTTSASALVKTRLQSFGGHAITLEDPPELPLQGIHGKGLCLQKEVTDFGQAIIESLRYGAPEIIYLGELRAPSDVSQALRAAVNGHLIIATIHAGSVIEAAQRISSLGSAVDGREMTQDLMASGLGVFVHQTLNTVKETGLKSLKVEFLQVAGEQGLSAQSLIRAGKMIQLGSEIMLQRNKLLLGKK